MVARRALGRTAAGAGCWNIACRSAEELPLIGSERLEVATLPRGATSGGLQGIATLDTGGRSTSRRVADLIPTTDIAEEATAFANAILGVAGISTLASGVRVQAQLAADAHASVADLVGSTDGEPFTDTTAAAAAIRAIAGRTDATAQVGISAGIDCFTAVATFIADASFAAGADGPRIVTTMAEPIVLVAGQPVAAGIPCTTIFLADPCVTAFPELATRSIATLAAAVDRIAGLIRLAGYVRAQFTADAAALDALLPIFTGHTCTFAETVHGITALPVRAGGELATIRYTGGRWLQDANGSPFARKPPVPANTCTCFFVAGALACALHRGAERVPLRPWLFSLPTSHRRKQREQAGEPQPAEPSRHHVILAGFS